MALLKGAIKKMKGSAGEFTFRGNSGRTIVSEKAASVKNVRSAAQQRVRMRWSNIVQMYKAISPLIDYGFEDKAQGVTDYNMFVKVNMQMPAVYLKKGDVTCGACVAAPYILTKGSIPAIEIFGEGSNCRTNISLSGLVIDESTTVGDFASAVIKNKNFKQDDMISFFSVLQHINANTGVPYVNATVTSVALDTESQIPLWTLVNKAGFTSKNGFLAHGENEGDGVFCWVHTRKKSDGKLKVSTQSLIDNNSMLANYTSEHAYYVSVNTYGGERNVALDPSSSINTVRPSSGGNGGTSGGNGGSTPTPNPSSGDDNTGDSF